ncbi:MAG: uroporphyrinogen-III synthase [Prevotellaceae bacterium]|jgi:uroporphyrinogen-III synthase|nr:uroporphyrinogen-III synthase [Prevotellaceae bacterium]
MKIQKILISQPEPTEKSPYIDLVETFGVEVKFKPFIQVEGVTSKEFRRQRVEILMHTAIVFTARTAVDNFFRICEELRVTIPETMKYFCTTEAIALYLQKYIVYRKRKIFFGTGGGIESILKLIGSKHKTNKFLLALSDNHKADLSDAFIKAKLTYTEAIFYRTVNADMKKFSLKDYDIIVFYSPADVKSFCENYPRFKQNDKIIATFGVTTAKAAEDAKLQVTIKAPTPEMPSIKTALEKFLKQQK